jgi:multicomponent K+:H+ antiporter subunit G
MPIAEIIIAVLLVVAGLFAFVGSFGLLKLPDQMTRLHAPTKATTLGVGGVLIASMLYFLLFEDKLSFHELLITLFLFLAAPISAFFIARVHLRNSVRSQDLPRPKAKGKPQDWAGEQVRAQNPGKV